MSSVTAPFPGYRLGQAILRDRSHVLMRATRLSDDHPLWLKYVDSSIGGHEAFAELRREAELTSGLHGGSFLRPIEVHETPAAGPVLVFEPFSGQPLADSDRSARLDLPAFFHISQAVTAAVIDLHSQRIIHKRLSPGAVFFDAASQQAKLGQLGRATKMHGKTRELAALEQEVSGFAYLSPEQTGRLNWAVGFGSDLYALGIIFYELLTRRLPFNAADPLEWIHCHVARIPVPPSEVDPRIPRIVSDIVIKLLGKNPADRYLSASGLLADLQRSEAACLESGITASFPLGLEDHSQEFRLPERIYGRSEHFATLSELLETTRNGQVRLATVTGHPGSGKSSLVYEWIGAMAGRSVLLAAGKYEQLQRDQPYMGLRRAIHSLCRYLSCESEDRRDDWKQRINTALGSIGQVMTDTFPALLPLIGEQPPVPELAPAEARNRFDEAFRCLIRALADPANPLVVFLDDVQWADRSSLSLLQSLLSAPEAGGLLLILGYRDQEPRDLESVHQTLTVLRSQGFEALQVAADPLLSSDISEMLADTMGGNRERYRELAQIIAVKTDGNPFFVRQFLLQLADEEVIFYKDGWRWDSNAARLSKVTDNVVAFVAERISRFPEVWQQLLQTCSCFGSRIRLDVLSRLHSPLGEDLIPTLDGVLASGVLLLRAGEYVFIHDRVREAAYSLIPEAKLPALHLAIAEALLSQSDQQISEDTFDIVHHLNLATPLLTDNALQFRARTLNLTAARRARNAAAYSPALDYARAACPPAGDPLWISEYDFCADAALVLLECLFFNELKDEFESFTAVLLGTLYTEQHLVPVHRIKILARSAGSRHQEAVTATYEALAYLGVEMPDQVDAAMAAMGEEISLINSWIAGRPIEELRNLPQLTDRRIEAIIAILISITPDTVMLGLGAHYGLVVARSVRLSLQHGYSELAAVAFANYSVVVLQTTGDVHTAYEWARLAPAIDEAHGGAKQSPALFIPGWLVAAWKLPVGSQVAIFDAASRAGIELGDILFGCFSAAAATVFTAASGVPLSEVIHTAQRYRAVIRQRVYSADYHCLLEMQFARALMGLTSGRTSLADAQVSLAELDAVRETRSAHQVGYYFLYQMRLAYLFGETEEALRWAAELKPYLPGLAGLLIQAEYAFLHGLILLSIDSPGEVREHLKNLKRWAQDCPENFQPWYLILEAELARSEGRLHQASGLLVKAIAAADENRLTFQGAHACELAIRLHFELEDRVAARAYLEEARRRYQAWGAVTKVADLADRYRDLQVTPTYSPFETDSVRPQLLDMLSLMKSAQAISSEIVMSRLVDCLMRTTIENACAEWGALILLEDQSLVLEAIRHANQDEEIQLLERAIDKDDPIPQRIVEYVASTRQPLVLSDARRSRSFAADPVIQRTQPRSVLCAPILHQGELSGIIYLENNLTAGAFTPDRLEILRLLSSQIAVSIKNARYHEKSLEWERVQYDLDSARAIQQSLLPQKPPDALPYLLDVRSHACYEVGGDYTDIITTVDGEYLMVVADVAGKGLASALVASSFRSAFRAIAGTGLPLHELARRLAHLHWSEGIESQFRYVTAAFLKLNRTAHSLEVVNAGHNPVLMIHPDGTQETFRASGPPLGILKGSTYKSETREFPPGTRLLAYTDGLTEVFRGDEEFGEERLAAAFARYPFSPANSVLDGIWKDLADFSAGSRQLDDMTALAICRLTTESV